jgi:hypothetical protein
LLIGAVCVLCGGSAGYLSGRITQTLETQEAVQGMQDYFDSNAEGDAKARLWEIEAVERGSTDGIVRLNCAFLRTRIRRLDPTHFGDRADEVKQFIERAGNKVAELEKAGRCGGASSHPQADAPSPAP